MIPCVKFKDVEAALLKEGFFVVGAVEDHVVFEHPDRHGDKPRYCAIHVPNPSGTVAELSVIESFEEAQIDIPRWDVVWSD